jgi:hypothetical protein
MRGSMWMVAGLLAALVSSSSCKKFNPAFCDVGSPCTGGRQCDLVAKECVDANVDLGPDSRMPDDLAASDGPVADLAGADLAGADLSVVDMVSPPMDLVGADLSGCGGTVCTPGGAGNAFCKNACMTTTAKCGTNGLCVP